MSYCFNLQCPNPADPANKNQLICRNCGFELLLQNRYRAVQKLLGEECFKVYDNETGRYKVITPILLIVNHPKSVAIIQQTAKVLSKINHLGIPKMDQDGYFTKNDNTHYLVMEYIEGLTLENWMIRRNNQPISEKLAIKWFEQMVKILDEFHCIYYYQRDMNARDITLKPDGNLALTGSQFLNRKIKKSKSYENFIHRLENTKPPTGISFGPSSGYSSPFSKDREIRMATNDFFFLGQIWVFLLTGKPAIDFPENPRTGKILWREYAPHISKNFADILDYLMAPFPQNRPQNCQVILKCITELKEEQANIKNKKKKKNNIIDSLINWLNQRLIYTFNLLRKMSQYLGLMAK